MRVIDRDILSRPGVLEQSVLNGIGATITLSFKRISTSVIHGNGVGQEITSSELSGKSALEREEVSTSGRSDRVGDRKEASCENKIFLWFLT